VMKGEKQRKEAPMEGEQKVLISMSRTEFVSTRFALQVQGRTLVTVAGRRDRDIFLPFFLCFFMTPATTSRRRASHSRT